MAQIPGEGHPDRWLYEQLRIVQKLLLLLALDQEELGTIDAQGLLAEVKREVLSGPGTS